MIGSLWYEQWNVGDEYETVSRTIDHAEVLIFGGVTGDLAMLHFSEEFAKTTPFGKRIAHGLLTMTLSFGSFMRLGLLDTTGMAFLNSSVKYQNPVFMGDTVLGRVSVKSKRETKKPDRGIIVVVITVINQRGEVVQEAEHTILVARKPK